MKRAYFEIIIRISQENTFKSFKTGVTFLPLEHNPHGARQQFLAVHDFSFKMHRPPELTN